MPRAAWFIAAAAVLAGCNTSETLDPDGARSAPPTTITGTETSATPTEGAQVALGSASSDAGRPALPNSMARVQLAPAVGATVSAAAPLSQRMETRGREMRIDFRGQGASGINYVIKGYFSASREANGTVVYYVWDVLDPAGNRVHRIFGQETTKGGTAGSDAWADVTPPTMEAIADKTVTDLAAWLASRNG